MATSYSLFEVGWEVCNKLGGIHTVIATKAKTLTERFGDEYVAVGPWLLSESDKAPPFEDDAGYRDFAESCRRMGLPVRVGRWLVPGEPRAILVEFSQLYDEKDAILAALWEEYGVDSISGGWDYAEPVLFGHAAGRVIEQWWEEFLAPYHRRAIVHAHEWMTASTLLYLEKRVPSIGTVFTTHATALGRALASRGHSLIDGLGGASARELAETHKVAAPHSMEGVGAREADVFTTVSELTADEAELLHERRPDPLTYNGLDLAVIGEVVAGGGRAEVRRKLDDLAWRFLGERVDDALFVAISGRYELRNKGIDVALDALARMNRADGRRVVFWALVPAGESGVRAELAARLQAPPEHSDGPLGYSTHALFDAERDPLALHCASVGLTNERGSRVRVIHVPIYLEPRDGLLDCTYEAVLAAMDVTAFPSYYEPWGYTPQESLAVGVPTITTDHAGIGRWAQRHGLGRAEGITVLERVHVEHAEVVERLADELELFAGGPPLSRELSLACRRTASLTSWRDFIVHYELAYQNALDALERRAESIAPVARRPKLTVPVQPTPAGSVPRLIPFDVSATLPQALRGLDRLARNLWWCWDPEGARLFEELSPRSWEACEHKPTSMLRRVYPEDLAAKAQDPSYVARLERVVRRFQAYMAREPEPIALSAEHGGATVSARNPIAYFCAEYGLHESLPIYSGGLGVLAGDHLKSASDLRLPFVAIGLFYSKGYLKQRVTPAGEQVAVDVDNELHDLPIELLKDDAGAPLEIALQLPGRELLLRALRVRVGRVPLYLLDSNTPSNRPEDRSITSKLYGGDQEARILQEIVLGRGGFRLLTRLGLEPAVYHINEGHAAFLVLERMVHLVRKEGCSFDEARELVRASTVFTTHTPVPAGHDRFGEDLMRRYFSDIPDRVGLSWEAFYALGHSTTERHAFNVTHLASRFASWCNGVSRLHGVASRKLLHPLWPGLLGSEVPVRSVTNGVHLATWTHPDLSRLLGAAERPVTGEDFALRSESIDSAELWEIKQRNKRRMVRDVRHSLSQSFLDQHDSPLLLTRMLDGLDEDAMYVGFARRFAPYKRAHLLFKDPDRLRALLDDPHRPLRVLIAGKAHPNDQRGREILRGILELVRRDDYAGKILFVENYEIDLARTLVQGVDVWLNNPTRMLEASGTSGMKAAANGALNFSIGDGWWPEASDGDNGWTIADGRLYDDSELQDQLDSTILYRMLEEELLPLYFERDESGVPRGWMSKVKRSLATIPPRFNTERMVGEYLEQAYLPLARRASELARNERAPLRDLAQNVHRIRRDFAGLSLVAARIADLSGLKVGDSIDVRVEVDLGALRVEDVTVELVLGHSTDEGDLQNMISVPLEPVPSSEGRVHTYEGRHRMDRSGVYSYGIRARPRSAADPSGTLRDLVLWA